MPRMTSYPCLMKQLNKTLQSVLIMGHEVFCVNNDILVDIPLLFAAYVMWTKRSANSQKFEADVHCTVNMNIGMERSISPVCFNGCY